MLLTQMRNPVPAGLLGILAPDSSEWYVVLKFSEIGYVKTYAGERIDTNQVLSALRHNMELSNRERAVRGQQILTYVNLVRAPELDSAGHSLEFAIRVESQSGQNVHQSMQLFGRRGVLEATRVGGAQNGSELVSLKGIMKNITFRSGQDYADFEDGDKIASMTFTQLIAGGNDPGTLAEKGRFAKWWDELTKPQKKIFGGLAFCVVAAVVAFLVIREIRSLKLHESFPVYPSHGTTNGKGRSTRRSSQRKRAFDYQKFYSDMMTQVSTRSFSRTDQQQNEETIETSHEVVAASPEVAGPSATASVTSEFIAQQKEFIEEQRRLMHQQAKLIEERSKLIEEKNQILAKQSEMIDNQLL
jgi:hypothetical protein